MTLSMRIVINLLAERYENLDMEDLCFILITIRDNCLNKETHDLLDKLVVRMWNERTSK